MTVEMAGRQIGLGPQQRALLAALALARGRAISRSRLIDLIWEGATPEGAAATLRTHILHLRRVLEPQRRAQLGYEVLVSVGGRKDASYALRLEETQVDALRFVRLTQEARRASSSGDPQGALERLDQALGLWYGPALEGVSDRSFAVAEANRLEELRLVAQEDRIDALLELGRHEEVHGELATLVREHPLRERLRSQLILALYRSERQADALAAYREIYQLLDEELGVAPGRPLRRLHQQVLNADPALEPKPQPQPQQGPGQHHEPPAVPRQLPPDVASFTGRREYLQELDALLPARAPGAGQTLVISSVSGTAGVGKTTLAVHWMHQVADRFPDGQLFVDLRGYATGSPMTVDEALGQLLRALGVAPAHLPEGPDEKAALYRSMLADKHMLILLDNAAGLGQVRPLLPGSPTCFTIVTSRNDLRGLTAFHDAHRIGLDVFSPEEALALLARIVGADRVRDEPEAAAELVRLCGHLALAVRVTAANLIGGRFRRIADMVRDLREGNRLAKLTVEGDQETAVRAALDLSYRALPAVQRGLFRLLGLAPAHDLSLRAIAALAGRPEAETARTLDHLVSRSLLDNHQPDRFHCHDLLRLYARERAGQEDSREEREDAVRRLFAWYLSTADRAAHRLYGAFYSWYAVPEQDSAGSVAAPLAFAERSDAAAWLNTERGNLLVCIEHAAEHGPYRFAWQLALALHGHLMAHGQRADWLGAARAGLRAADAGQDLYGRAAMHWSLGYVHWELAQHDEAVWHSARAESLYGEAGLSPERGGALLGLTAANREKGSLELARAYALQARDVYRRTDDPAGTAWALALLGFVCLDQGRFGEAREHFTLARDAGQRSDDPHAAILPLYGLGAAQHGLGRFEDATEHLTQALTVDNQLLGTYAGEGALCCLAMVCRDTGDPRLALKHATDALNTTHRTHRRLIEVDALNTLGTVLLRLDDLPGALSHHRRALDLATKANCRRAEAAAHGGLAAVHRHQGQHRHALHHTRTSLAIARQTGLPVAEGEALTGLAGVQLALGHHNKAMEAVEPALALHRTTGYRLGLARALETAGEVLKARNDTRTAQRYRREAAGLYKSMGVPALYAQAG
ncbi:AfsR/SARP family transcriptional regulator [Streptomyces gobiensis]|uniref:AfsR/SARP family transcriptional regulator n=1 Tax=Streptomyces gobiensis TaxID=2875706 RepID=UPI001E38E1B9|nr:BTAD domain-containing putative transcriptional regulator [Streptomyces gobiensis]UGY94586.1 tetratricopeptide repeat protein [Streptomyces gobiensis]